MSELPLLPLNGESCLVSDEGAHAVNATQVRMSLAPGCGSRLVFRMRRFVNPPTLSHPWPE